jgi:nitroreductase
METIRDRHSTRGAFDTGRPVTAEALSVVLEAAQWAPTPTNMQNFEIVVVDAKEQLDAIGKIPADMQESFLRENFAQLSFSDASLLEKKTGMRDTDFPRAWTNPAAWDPYSDSRSQITTLAKSIGEPPLLLIMVYDCRKRAPGSDHDRVGLIGLGCVLENIWLAAASQGFAFHVLTVVGDGPVEEQMRIVLNIPEHMKIAFACSLGYAANPTVPYVRVRRELKDFVHYNSFGLKS